MLNRRQAIGSATAAAAFAITGNRSWAEQQVASGDVPLLASPPVVQHPKEDSFGVSVAVSGLATASVEWGFDKGNLNHFAHASHHGLILADDRALHIRVQNDKPFPEGQTIYYRVVAQSLEYENAYRLNRGNVDVSKVFALRLPNSKSVNQTVAVINDTHENLPTLLALHKQIEDLDPDLVIWNGDTCNDFDAKDRPEQVLLNPMGDLSLGFASTRPIVFVPGNHDVRGVRAREVTNALPGWPGQTDLPYNQVIRLGPMALFLLDTGEDKPDAHPVFAGTANYEPYRTAQARWLKENLQHSGSLDAPFKLAFCHIPLRGQAGQRNGMTLDGGGSYCGFGAELWMPHLRESGCQCVVSGHTHTARFDEPTKSQPIAQLIGGGPQPDRARLIVIKTGEDADQLFMRLENQTLEGDVTHHYGWTS